MKDEIEETLDKLLDMLEKRKENVSSRRKRFYAVAITMIEQTRAYWITYCY